jgi:hypothetical protein
LNVFGWGEIIALTNGKNLRIPGSFEVKGEYVVFENDNGDMNQLPLKIVDLEKSKKLTELDIKRKEEEYQAKLETLREAEKRSKKRTASLQEVAEYVEKNRPPDKPAPANLAISNDGVTQFVDENPVPGNGQVAVDYGGSERGTVESFQEARDEYGAGYQKLAQEVTDLQKRIEEEEYRRESNSTLAAFGAANYQGKDDEGNDVFAESPDTSPAFDKMEEAEKNIAQLKKDLSAKKTELKAYEKEARSAGVRDYRRYKAPPAEGKEKQVVAKKPKIKQPKEDLNYEEDKEFYEGEEEPPQ